MKCAAPPLCFRLCRAPCWIFALYLFSYPAHATPSWIEKNKQAWQEAPADPQADVLVLVDDRKISIEHGSRASSECRIATKILRKDGLKEAMLREVISPTRKLKDLKGWMLRDVDTVELQKENIVESSASGSGGYYYNDRILAAVFPEAREGDIVAFEYRIEETDVSIRQQFFSLPEGAPVLSVHWSLTIPKNWALHVPTRLPYGVEGGARAAGFEWTGKDIPAVAKERYRPPADVAANGLLVYAFDSISKDALDSGDWIECGRWASAVLEPVQRDPKVQAKAKELASGAASETDIARAICRFAVEDIRYVAVELGKGRWYPRAPGEILETKYGDCKDKAAIARALLAAVGIPSWPVLIGAQSDIVSEIPSPFQFDHCILGLPGDRIEGNGPARIQEGDVFLFDATAQGIPWGSLPEHLRGKRALVARSDGGQLIRVSKMQCEENRRQTKINLALRGDGTVAGSIRIAEWGSYARARHGFLGSFTEENLGDFYADTFTPSFSKIQVENVSVVADADSSVVTANLLAKLNLPSKAGPMLIPAYVLQSHDVEEGLDAAARHHPLWLGPAGESITETEWTLPSGWHFDAKIDAKSAICPAGSCEWSIKAAYEKASHSTRMTSSGEEVAHDQVQSVAGVIEQGASAKNLFLIARSEK